MMVPGKVVGVEGGESFEVILVQQKLSGTGRTFVRSQPEPENSSAWVIVDL